MIEFQSKFHRTIDHSMIKNVLKIPSKCYLRKNLQNIDDMKREKNFYCRQMNGNYELNATSLALVLTLIQIRLRVVIAKLFRNFTTQQFIYYVMRACIVYFLQFYCESSFHILGMCINSCRFFDNSKSIASSSIWTSETTSQTQYITD